MQWMLRWVLLIGCSFAALGQAKTTPKLLDSFDISKAPSQEEWRFFFEMNANTREKLWQDMHRKGKNLGHWHWAWRIGWARACAMETSAFCERMLEMALFDRAMVVRAEAASRLGEKYAGTRDEKVQRLLSEALRLPANERNGKPLYVQKRVLFALHQIGGPDALKRAENIAKKDPQLGDYVNTLRKF